MGKNFKKLAKIRTCSEIFSKKKKKPTTENHLLTLTQIAVQGLLVSEARPQCDVVQLLYKQEAKVN